MQEITLRLKKKCFENSLTVKVEHENEIMNFSSAPTLMAKTFVCTSQTATRVCLLLIFKEKINKACLAEVCLKLISCDMHPHFVMCAESILVSTCDMRAWKLKCSGLQSFWPSHTNFLIPFFIHSMKTISLSIKKMSFLDFCTTIRPKMMSFIAKVPVRSATIKMRVGRSCGGLKYSLTIFLLIIDVVPMEIILKIFKHILIVRFGYHLM